MAEFNIQSDSVDVTRIMEQIRQRIREKRGTDYTEQQTRELATVKLEQFLDPKQVRSDLVEHYRKLEPPAALDPIPHIRKLLNPILKLFINPNPVAFALTRQAEINAWTLQLLQQQTDLAERVTKQFERAGAKFAAREELDALNYEVLNNLVVEMSRLSVDMKNHRMLVESVASRLDFDERRARALESVVQSRSPQPAGSAEADAGEGAASTGSGRPRRRRRRSRRRSGATAPSATDTAGAASDTTAQDEVAASTSEPATPPPSVPAPPAPSEPASPPPEAVMQPPAAASDATPPRSDVPTPASPEPPPAPAVPPTAATGSPASPPLPSTPAPSAAPAPPAAPATETAARPTPEGEPGTDEQ